MIKWKTMSNDDTKDTGVSIVNKLGLAKWLKELAKGSELPCHFNQRKCQHQSQSCCMNVHWFLLQEREASVGGSVTLCILSSVFCLTQLFHICSVFFYIFSLYHCFDALCVKNMQYCVKGTPYKQQTSQEWSTVAGASLFGAKLLPLTLDKLHHWGEKEFLRHPVG